MLRFREQKLKVNLKCKSQRINNLPVGSQRTVNYKDGTSTTLKLLALDDLSHSLTYELIAATPALTVSSAVHTIKLYPVTFDGTSLIYWSTDYSNDATQEVIQDSKYKKQEYFADLLQALGQNKKQKTAAAPVGSPKKAKK
jgi:hypothetical protein